MLSPETASKVHIFNTYLLDKLMNTKRLESADLEDPDIGRWASRQVEANFESVQKWTRRIDLFEREVLVLPINMFKHWFCIVVTNPAALLSDESRT